MEVDRRIATQLTDWSQFRYCRARFQPATFREKSDKQIRHRLTANFFTALSSPSRVRLYMGNILLIRLTDAGCCVSS
jgi:hypothetical protein